MVNIGEEIKDLKDLKLRVIDLGKSVIAITDGLEDLKDLKLRVITITDGLDDIKTSIENTNLKKLDADLNNDGKVSKIELMVVKTLQKVAEKTQKNGIYNVGMILGFLLVSAILRAVFGIQLSF